jgi:hypothetical protein
VDHSDQGEICLIVGSGFLPGVPSSVDCFAAQAMPSQNLTHQSHGIGPAQIDLWPQSQNGSGHQELTLKFSE